MARTQDPAVTEAALDAAVRLLSEHGYARMTLEAVAREAGVGKPALYRRFADKAELVAAAIARAIPPMDEPAEPDEDVRAALRRLVEQAAPPDPQGYGVLVGGLMAEQRHHPELLDAYRRRVLGPRRAAVRAAIERAQREGRIGESIDPELAVDMLGGAFMVRTFAGLPVDATWREALFEQWWAGVAADGGPPPVRGDRRVAPPASGGRTAEAGGSPPPSRP